MRTANIEACDIKHTDDYFYQCRAVIFVVVVVIAMKIRVLSTMLKFYIIFAAESNVLLIVVCLTYRDDNALIDGLLI